MIVEQFISEPLSPEDGTFDAGGMARGEAGLPGRFRWRERTYRVVEVLTAWKTTSPEGGSGEVYLRRHWWEVLTDQELIMKIYCERQQRGRDAKGRWFVYTVRSTTAHQGEGRG